MRAPARAVGLALLLSGFALPTLATPGNAASDAAATEAGKPAALELADPTQRTGREIYARFHEGLADPDCESEASTRWSMHFSHVPKQLARGRGDVLSLFGYVVDALRDAGLPTEYALIPFVESGYKPGARSASGPAGLWQFIGITARKHKIAIRSGYDGRLSPVDSTRAAVRYLKTLHGMFAGNWQLAVMGYNAGEYRVFGALKRHGQRARDAELTQLTSLPGITQAYVRKLHALSCVLAKADDHDDWMQALDRKVPRLVAIELPPNVDSLDAWSTRQGLDAAVVKRLNPAYAKGRLGRVAAGSRVLAPATAGLLALTTTTADAGKSPDAPTPASAAPPQVAGTPAATDPDDAPRAHIVERGESAWIIARRYDIDIAQLLERNGLDTSSTLQPGMVLALDAQPAESGAAAASVAH